MNLKLKIDFFIIIYYSLLQTSNYTQMNRPSWQETHMKQAELMASRSTCAKLQVGAVLVRDNRTVSQGYNGTGPECENCINYWETYFRVNSADETPFFPNYVKYPALESKTFDEFLKSNQFRILHKDWSVENELHAEQNCILWAAREGIATKDTTLYTIYSPCINCAKVIHMAGIKEVYYKNIYESDQSGLSYLTDNNILCHKI